MSEQLESVYFPVFREKKGRYLRRKEKSFLNLGKKERYLEKIKMLYFPGGRGGEVSPCPSS